MNIKRFFTLLLPVLVLLFCGTTGCDKSDNTSVNFTIDLTQAQFGQLNNFGGQVIYNGILIVRISNTAFAAVSAYCTVDNEVLSFSPSQGYFVCPMGHEFSELGTIINSPGAAPLIVYHTNLVNNLLQIYS